MTDELRTALNIIAWMIVANTLMLLLIIIKVSH